MKCAILLSVYNAEATLERTLQSLENQTRQDFRIVALDDASSDGSREILFRWKKKFGEERFTLLRNKVNLGLTRSLNLGLKVIHEPFTARLDADDWWDKTKLEKQLLYGETHPTTGVIGTYYQNVKPGKVSSIILPINNSEIKRDIFRRNPFAHSAVVFRTELVKNAGAYNPSLRYGQDYELWLRLFPQTEFYNVPETLCFRSIEDTLTSKNQRAQMFQSMKTLWKYLRLYKRPLLDYRFLFEPLLVALAPNWLRTLKRQYL